MAKKEVCPTYTLRADTRFGVLGMICLLRLAREWTVPGAPGGVARAELIAELEAKVREFERWEEKWG